MEYPEDLTFTAEYLKNNPIVIRDTALYKDIKKIIWYWYCEGLYSYTYTSTYYQFEENELKALEALKEEGFKVMVNAQSDSAHISWRSEENYE